MAFWNQDESCLSQAISAFAADPLGRSVIGVSPVPAEEAGAYGVVKVDSSNGAATKPILEFVEKPDSIQASCLAENGVCRIVLGPYILHYRVMEALLRDVAQDERLNGEVQLTPALIRDRESHGLISLDLIGGALDTGNPTEYARTLTRLAQHLI